MRFRQVGGWDKHRRDCVLGEEVDCMAVDVPDDKICAGDQRSIPFRRGFAGGSFDVHLFKFAEHCGLDGHLLRAVMVREGDGEKALPVRQVEPTTAGRSVGCSCGRAQWTWQGGGEGWRESRAFYGGEPASGRQRHRLIAVGRRDGNHRRQAHVPVVSLRREAHPE